MLIQGKISPKPGSRRGRSIERSTVSWKQHTKRTPLLFFPRLILPWFESGTHLRLGRQTVFQSSDGKAWDQFHDLPATFCTETERL